MIRAVRDLRPDLSKDRLRLWLRLLKLSRKIETRLRERLREEHATTLPRFDVMAALSRAPGGLKMSEISGVLKVSNGNVTGIVDRLVEDKLAERLPSPDDRRVSRVRLTEAGAAEFARQAAAHESWLNEMLREVEPDEAALLSDILGRIARGVDAGKERL